jgi:hypothetical protein
MAGNKTLIDKYVARLLMLSFFLPMQPQVVALLISSAWFIFRTFQDKQQTPIGNYLLALCIGGLYFLYLIAIPFTPENYRHVTLTLCEYKQSYVLLPLLYAAVSPQKIRVIINELAWFVYFSVGIGIIANGWFIIKYASSPSWFHGVNHVTYRIFFEDLTGIHPTYISMYLVLAIGILLLKADKMNRKFKYVLFYVALAFLLPLLAKSPLIALVLMFIHTAWIRRKKLGQYKWLFIGVLAMITLSYVFVPFVSQRVNEMAGIGASLKENVTDNSIHERKMIFTVDVDMVKRYWTTGCGPGRLLYLLKQKYFFYSLYYKRDVKAFDPHNEYFYQWISFGVAGIGFFLFGLGMHFFSALKNRDNLYIYLLLVLDITFFTESVLATQHGLLFYAFFSSLLFFDKQKPSGIE